MRIVSTLGRVAQVLLGAVVLGFLAYDASAVTRLVGLDPEGHEAGVVLAGLAVAAVSIGLGLLSFSGQRRRHAAGSDERRRFYSR